MAPASRPEEACDFCKKALDGPGAPHLCASCGHPQSLKAGEDYFTALDAPKRFALDLGAVEKRFYELSRALHPDRFTTLGPEAQKLSLDRMSFLNQAYSTLKSPEERRSYLLSQEGIAVTEKDASGQAQPSGLPVELAEQWFDVQDQLMEDREKARAALARFEAGLKELDAQQLAKLNDLERSYDEHPARPTLEELAALIRARNYLKSMERNVIRIKMTPS